ncbi:peptide-methionine (S)-S-oxide reductase MsrA [Desertibacillus haloalkaliphilus]|uniref:peptide-methionine (S)-S-oxide reductase MsrA n=1 Tax=Desertibacillus haloalkaliphilus TaxID=1328930 RepID=UPI001C2791C1|nr:peptide-methionine (S)-S-oxide reductase MsrA [Desertibacillus haloalkaliphilus]MBU8907648.1 peptide-methionine (S)-S-oxide reductase MsrA [Desertibacillus haloalkaliphilus]
MEKAVFAAGCFWGVEAFFEEVRGVEETRVGYTGGDVEHPSYEEVKSGQTGHAEAIEIWYNPWKISYAELVDKFFECHNPTTRNRQGIDVGTQYRSAIFFQNLQQLEVAVKKKAELNRTSPKLIVTEVAPAKPFYQAEEYHQKYFQKNGTLACGI